MSCDPLSSTANRRLLSLFASALGVLCSSALCCAQFGGAGGNVGGGGNQLGGGNQFGGGNQVGGILIDAEGVLRTLETKPLSAKLQQAARDAFVTERLSGDLVPLSSRRHISLIQLERACARQFEADGEIGDDLRYLAGLQQIDFLFVDSERDDLVIAGPAEGFVPDVSGRMVGLTTGRPPLRLDDLIVALQAARPGNTAIGCSIDPEPARLARMQEFVTHNSSETSSAGAARRYEQMAEILGLQQVSVFGVPADTHFALTLVEADFRMKRISLGVEASGVRGLKSHLSLITPGGNSIQRWWFTPKYDQLAATADRTAFQLAGQRVQLHAQEEIAAASGVRSDSPVTRASTHNFAKMFTAAFPELAARSPVFAELQNLFDLAIIAELIRAESIAERIGWELTLFSRTGSELVPVYSVPRQVASMSTFRKARRGLILGLVGGVTIEPRHVLRDISTTGDDALRLDGTRRTALERAPSDEHAWWWD